MRKIAFIVFFLVNFNSFSQRDILFEADLGAAIPTHKNLKNVFDLGFDFNAGFAINVLRSKLYVKPIGGVKWYFKKIEDVNSVTEHLRTWKVGIEMRYYCLKKDGWMLAPYIRLDNNWSSNYYSASSYNPFTKQTSGDVSDNFLEGKGFSFAIGQLISFKNIYLKIDYEFFSPTMKVSQVILDDAYSQGIIIDPTSVYNLNSLDLTVGYTFGF